MESKRNSPGLQSQAGTRGWVRLVRPILTSFNQTRFQLLVPVLQLSTRDAEPPCSNARKSPRRRAFPLLCADFIIICELGKYCIAIGKCFQQQLYLDKKSFSGQVENNDMIEPYGQCWPLTSNHKSIHTFLHQGKQSCMMELSTLDLEL